MLKAPAKDLFYLWARMESDEVQTLSHSTPW